MSRVRTLLATNILVLLGLLALLAASVGVERLFDLGGSLHMGPLMAGLLAAIPGAGWVIAFSWQDAGAALPKRHVAGIFILGALVAGPIADFATGVALHQNAGSAAAIQPFALERIVAAVAIVGMLQETCKYAVLRYSVYPSPEFDEPVDGIVYAVALSVGLAAHDSFDFFASLDNEILLSSAVSRTVTSMLIHLSTGSVLGIGLSMAKFGSLTSPRRGMVLLGSVVAAAALNGLFALVLAALSSAQLQPRLWNPLAFTFGLTVVVFLLTSVASRRVQLRQHAEVEA